MSARFYFAVSLVFFLLVTAGMLYTEKKAACGGNIIIPLEMAPDIQSFKALLVPACQLEWVERNTKLDFVFLVAYTALIIATLYTLQGTPPAGWFKPLVVLSVFPALFDAIENFLLLKFLHVFAANITTAEYAVYFWCVRLKFGVLLVIVGFILFLLARRIAHLFKTI